MAYRQSLCFWSLLLHIWGRKSIGAKSISTVAAFLKPVAAYLGPQKHLREWHISHFGVLEACGCVSGAAEALARMFRPMDIAQKQWVECMLSSGADEFLNGKRVPIISRPWGSKLCTVGAVDVLCV